MCMATKGKNKTFPFFVFWQIVAVFHNCSLYVNRCQTSHAWALLQNSSLSEHYEDCQGTQPPQSVTLLSIITQSDTKSTTIEFVCNTNDTHQTSLVFIFVYLCVCVWSPHSCHSKPQF